MIESTPIISRSMACVLFVIALHQCLIQGAFASSIVNIMTYNVQGGTGLNRVHNLTRTGEVVRNNSVHLVGMQEIDYYNLRNYENQPQMFAKFSGMPDYRFGKMRDFENGGYGILTMSALPILDTRMFYYWNTTAPSQLDDAEPFSNPNVPPDFSQGAVAIKVRPVGLEEDIWFVTTHLYAAAGGDEDVIEVQQLIDFVKELDSPNLIITGDFNSFPTSAAIELMSKTFNNVWDDCAIGSGFTFPSDKPVERIDYIFAGYKPAAGEEAAKERATSPKRMLYPEAKEVKFGCLEAYIPNTQASDHRPLVAIMQLEVI